MIIKKLVGERLGMNIKGGVQGSPGNPLDKSDEGVFISKINSNGAVHRDGRLKVSLPSHGASFVFALLLFSF